MNPPMLSIQLPWLPHMTYLLATAGECEPARSSSLALMATMTVLAALKTAPTADWQRTERVPVEADSDRAGDAAPCSSLLRDQGQVALVKLRGLMTETDVCEQSSEFKTCTAGTVRLPRVPPRCRDAQRRWLSPCAPDSNPPGV